VFIKPSQGYQPINGSLSEDSCPTTATATSSSSPSTSPSINSSDFVAYSSLPADSNSSPSPPVFVVSPRRRSNATPPLPTPVFPAITTAASAYSTVLFPTSALPVSDSADSPNDSPLSTPQPVSPFESPNTSLTSIPLPQPYSNNAYAVTIVHPHPPAPPISKKNKLKPTTGTGYSQSIELADHTNDAIAIALSPSTKLLVQNAYSTYCPDQTSPPEPEAAPALPTPAHFKENKKKRRLLRSSGTDEHYMNLFQFN